MVDLKAIQDRLNNDEAYRAEFIRDPAALLRKEGLVLGDTHLKQLEGLAQQLNNPDQATAGSNISATPDREPTIGIGIRWSF